MTIEEFKKEQAIHFGGTSLFCANGRDLQEYISEFKLPENYIQTLNGKKLLLVGGGRSPIQETLDNMHIDCDVTNVDPYADNNTKSARTIYKKDFIDVDFVNEFDECWALWSLPLYSQNAWHAACFYIRAAIALKPGGKLRVAPHPECIRGIVAANHIPQRHIKFLEDELDKIFDSYNMMEFKNTNHSSILDVIFDCDDMMECTNTKHPTISAPNPDDITIEPPQTGLRKIINKFKKQKEPPVKTPVQEHRCTVPYCSIFGFTAPELEYDKELLNKYLKSVYPDLYWRYRCNAY